MFSNVTIRDGHSNFFTPMRLALALMVLFGHAFVIAQRNVDAEPMILLHYKASYLAVNMFFIVSGFLVTKSMLYRKDMADYGAARFLRIYPALLVHVLFVMFIMGPFVTSMTPLEFFAHPDFWTQPFRVLSFADTEMVMPGALASNHEQLASAPLWTLRYEVLAYIGTAIAFALGFMKKRWMILLQFVALCLLWPAAHLTGVFENLPATLQSLLRFGLCYTLGAFIYAYRDKLCFNLLSIAIFALIIPITAGTAFTEITINLFLAQIIFFFAYIKAPRLGALQKLSDTSYGIYIYHWAIMQWVFYHMPELNTFGLIMITLPLTVIIAQLSWHYVEKPALKLKGRLAKIIKARLMQTEPLPVRN